MRGAPERAFADYRRRGDARAFAACYDATVEEVVRVAVRLARGPAEAEDLVQATYLAAIQGAAAFDEERAIVPWLVGICVNQARKLRRVESRAGRLSNLDPEQVRREQSRQRALDPGDEAQKNELAQKLAEAIARLPEVYRPVLALNLQHELTPIEIARALGRPPGTVRVQLLRGLELVRGELPKGLALAVLAWLLPTRGLAAVKELVVAKAGTAGAAVVAASTAAVGSGALASLGGVVVMKKVVAVTVLALLLVGTWWAWLDARPDPAPGLVAPGPRAATLAAAATGDPVAAGPGDRAELPPARAAVPGFGSAKLQLVWDADGTPAAFVHGRVLEHGRPNPECGSSYDVASDREGRIVMPEVMPGQTTIHFQRFTAGFVARAGEAVEKTVRIPRGIQLAVRVVDPDRRGIAGAVIVSDESTGFTVTAGTTDADGWCRLRDCGASDHLWFAARAAGFAPSARWQLQGRVGESVTREFVLQRGGGAVRGVVRDARGEPCPGARVVVGPFPCTTERGADGDILPPPPDVTARTDAHGGFLVEGVPKGRTFAAARTRGAAFTWVEVEVPESAAAAVAITLQPGARVTGHVRDGEGRPVAARVMAHAVDARGASLLHDSRCEAQTAADGSYSMVDVVPGEIQVSASHGAEHVQQRLAVAAGRDHEVDLVFQGPPAAEDLAGVLVDERGKPLANWFLLARRAGPARLSGGGRTQAGGEFSLHRLEAGPLVLEVFGDGDRPGHLPLLTIGDLQRGMRDVRVVVPDAVRNVANVRLVVQDEAGQPIAGAKVTAERVADRRAREALSRQDGATTIERLPPGRYRFRVAAVGRGEHGIGERDLTGGEDADLGVVRMPKGITVRARIRARDGGAVGSASLRVLAAQEGRECGTREGAGERDLAIGPLAPGSYVALAGGAGLAWGRFPFTIAEDETPRFEWSLERGVRCRIEVRDAETAPLSFYANVRGTDPSGAEVFWQQLHAHQETKRMQGETWLAPGIYRIEAETSRGWTAQTTITVRADDCDAAPVLIEAR